MGQTIVVAEIDTVDYDYPSCGGYTAIVKVVSGVRANLIVTLESNYQRCWTGRKIKMPLCGNTLGMTLAIYHGYTDRDGDNYDIWDVIDADYIQWRIEQEDYILLRRGIRVQ